MNTIIRKKPYHANKVQLVRTTYHLTKMELADLRALSKKTGMSVAEIIRRAVDAYLDANAKKTR